MLRNLSVVEGMDLDALLHGHALGASRLSASTSTRSSASRPYANVGVLAGHSAIRTAVMGEEASTKRVRLPNSNLHPCKHDRARGDASRRAGFASSFSPNHSGWGGKPMPSTIADDEELQPLAGELARSRRGIFVMATGPRGTPDFMESDRRRDRPPGVHGDRAHDVQPGAPGARAAVLRALRRRRIARGREVYIHTSCQPLSFDFTLREPYILYSHDAFDAGQGGDPEDARRIYRDPAFRRRLRENLKNPKSGILFYGDWSQVERTACR